MGKICGHGDCEKAQRSLDRPCGPALAEELLLFKGVCNGCGKALLLLPRTCHPEFDCMENLTSCKGKCKEQACDLHQACKDAEHIVGMPKEALVPFKLALETKSKACSCSGEEGKEGRVLDDGDPAEADEHDGHDDGDEDGR